MQKKSFWKSDWFLMVDFLYLIPPIFSLFLSLLTRRQSSLNRRDLMNVDED
jgi:hypothetical protein